jgi:hypothetical protein
MNGEFCASVMVKNCYDKFDWRLIVVYGSPYEEGKLRFIQELDSFLDNWDRPTVLGVILIWFLAAKRKTMA